MPEARYEAFKKPWIVSRSNLALSVVMRHAPRRHSWVTAELPYYPSPTTSCSARPLAALGTVEDHPRAEVVREVLEAMFHTGRDEEDIAGGVGGDDGPI